MLPRNFNSWNHLRDQFSRYHNRNVATWFKNQPADDISTPKRSLRHACTIQPSDTAEMILLRKFLFEFDAGYTQSLQAPIYGVPVDVLQGNREFEPQVHLHFQEKYPYIADRLRPVRGQISFVLKNTDFNSGGRSQAEALARNIKRAFATPIFVWNKGKFYYYYRDKERGYDLRLLVSSQAEGDRVTRAVLSIQGHPFNDDFSDYVENSRSYPNNPGTQRVYGQSVPKPIRRPTADVRFRYAQLLIHGRTKVINLVATPEVALRQVIEKLTVV